MSEMLEQVEWLDLTLHPRLVLEAESIELAYQLIGLQHPAGEMRINFRVLCVVCYHAGRFAYTSDSPIIRPQAFAEFGRDLKKVLSGDPREAKLASVGQEFVLTVNGTDDDLQIQVTMREGFGRHTPTISASAGLGIWKTEVTDLWGRELTEYSRQLDKWVSANAAKNIPDLKIYSLPFKFEDLHSCTDLDPYFARFAGLRADEITAVLREDWQSIKSPQLAAFRDALFTFTPTSLVYAAGEPNDDWRKGWWLRIKLPATDRGAESEVNLHAPPDREVIEKALDGANLPEREVVIEFLSSFYKLSNALDGSFSAFYEPPWFRLEQSGYYDDVDEPEHFDPRREWADSFLIYCTFDGNVVLLNPNGKLSWYLSAENRIRPLAVSFSGFLEKCALCYRVEGMLDYYNCEDLLCE